CAQHLPVPVPQRCLHWHSLLRLQDLDRGPVPPGQAQRQEGQDRQCHRPRPRAGLCLLRRGHGLRQGLRRELDPRPPHQPPRGQEGQERR
ncbi:hypothetical protein BN1723_020834, partial [Verticillium longisporum]